MLLTVACPAGKRTSSKMRISNNSARASKLRKNAPQLHGPVSRLLEFNGIRLCWVLGIVCRAPIQSLPLQVQSLQHTILYPESCRILQIQWHRGIEARTRHAPLWSRLRLHRRTRSPILRRWRRQLGTGRMGFQELATGGRPRKHR